MTGGRGSRKEKEGVVYPRHHSAVLGDSGGVLTPLTSAWYCLSPLVAFTSGAYFLHNGRQ